MSRCERVICSRARRPRSSSAATLLRRSASDDKWSGQVLVGRVAVASMDRDIDQRAAAASASLPPWRSRCIAGVGSIAAAEYSGNGEQ